MCEGKSSNSLHFLELISSHLPLEPNSQWWWKIPVQDCPKSLLITSNPRLSVRTQEGRPRPTGQVLCPSSLPSPSLLSSKLSLLNLGFVLFKEKLLEFRKMCSFQQCLAFNNCLTGDLHLVCMVWIGQWQISHVETCNSLYFYTCTHFSLTSFHSTWQ